MNAIPYTTKSGLKRFKPEVTQEEAYEDTLGFCIACGEEAYSVEPDAEKYECECCGERKVYGLAQLAILGLLTFQEEDGEEDNEED